MTPIGANTSVTSLTAPIAAADPAALRCGASRGVPIQAIVA